jgi:hypothetical protein
MSTFPLYDTLCNDINSKEYEKDLTATLKKNMIKKIESLDQDTIELIYALICHYQEQFKESDNCILPYQGKYTNETDISFDLDLFPNKLKHILLKFINMHSGRNNIQENSIQDNSIQEDNLYDNKGSIKIDVTTVINSDSLNNNEIIEVVSMNPFKNTVSTDSIKKSPKNKINKIKKSK